MKYIKKIILIIVSIFLVFAPFTYSRQKKISKKLIVTYLNKVKKNRTSKKKKKNISKKGTKRNIKKRKIQKKSKARTKPIKNNKVVNISGKVLKPANKPIIKPQQILKPVQNKAIKFQNIKKAVMIPEINRMVMPEMIHNAIAFNNNLHRQGLPPQFNKVQLKEIFISQIDNILRYNPGINNFIKKPNSLRVATYNIHTMKNPQNVFNRQAVLDVINNTNSDIMVLQEITKTQFDYLKNNMVFADMGYHYSVYGPATRSGNFGNCIISKVLFAVRPFIGRFYGHDRSFITVELDLSKYGKNNLVIYGTHLEVNGEQNRVSEIRALLNSINNYNNNKNIIIAADYNSVQNTLPLQILENNGYRNNFDIACIQKPHFTHWSGKVIDFLYMKNQDLSVSGGYVYYSSVSDHLPVIMDINL